MRDYIGGLVLGILLGLALGASSVVYYQRQVHFSVGECVRELGYSAVEKITFITDGGAIETQYPDFKWLDGKIRTQVYEAPNKLIKVDCK